MVYFLDRVTNWRQLYKHRSSWLDDDSQLSNIKIKRDNIARALLIQGDPSVQSSSVSSETPFHITWDWQI